jgi:lipopolysaccharide/colanic/teichoic acid biosynthesis glycosyltransferase
MNGHLYSSAETQEGMAVSAEAYHTTLRSSLDRSLAPDRLNWIIQACASLFGLMLLSPLMVLIGIVIKLTDNGPVFYRGERVGRGKRIFKIYKFRTLVPGAEQKIGARLLDKEDQGVYYTKIGRLLKRTKLDELPQLFNVIRGEMRLAGPRPLRPIFLDQLEQTVAYYAYRFLVPPGITGIAQLRGGYYTSPRNKLRYDLIYIKRRSLLLDFQLVFFTFVKILNRWLSGVFFVLFLFLFVSFMPASLQSFLYISILGVRISLVYVFILLVTAGLFFKKGPAQVALYRVPLNRPLFLFLVLSGISAFFSEDLQYTVQRAGYYVVTGFLVAFVIVNSLATKGFILLTARVIALTSVMMSVLGLFQIFLFNYTVAVAASLSTEKLVESYIRASSLLGNPVVLSVYLVLGLPLVLAELTRATAQRERDFWLICATLSFMGIFFTQTRVGLLALLVTGTAFLARRLSHAVYFSSIFGLCLLFLVFLGSDRFSPVGIYSEAAEWLQEKTSILETFPTKTWLIGGEANAPYPLATPAAPQYSLDPDEDKADDIPNMHVTLALEHGITGWAVIMWLICSALWAMKQACRKTQDEQLQSILRAIISSVLGFLISMNAMNVFHDLTLQIFFWSLIGIGLGIVVHLNGSRRHNLIWRFGDAGD